MKTKLLLKSIIMCFILIPYIGIAQIQIGQDIDGEAAGDESGYSVSSSSDGTIVAIGAPTNDGVNGGDSGHVRVYKNISGISWTQIGQDIDGEATDDRSGQNISLSSNGNIVAIGAEFNDGNGSNSGHVRVYENISGTWTQIGQDIDGEATDDRSGSAVSLSADGTIVAIGAGRNDGTGGGAGHVRVYQNISGTWTQIGQDIDGEVSGDESGKSVSLSSDGSIVAIGAEWNNNPNGNNSGHVRVYQNISGTWTQIGQDIDGRFANDRSGASVSLSSNGTIVAIGAPFYNGNGVDSGHVRVFENISGTWTQIGSDINGEAAGNFSGDRGTMSLSSDGTIVAIGAVQNSANGVSSGHVRVYQNASGIWTQFSSDIDSEAAGDFSGFSTSLSSDGSIVSIGAVRNDGNGTSAGHVRVFNLSNPVKRVIYVDKDATGSNDGTSWTNAFTDLKDALLTTPDNEIWIADGIYAPHASDRNISFLVGNSSEIYGGFNGTETDLSQRDFTMNETILSGDLLGNDTNLAAFNHGIKTDNTLHVVRVTSENVILDGITITNGYASVTSPAIDSDGAAILKSDAVNNLTIKNCTIKNNVSYTRGNVLANFNGNGNLTIENTIFDNNLALYAAGIYSFTNTSSVTTTNITNCLFTNNATKDNGPPNAIAGSSMWLRAVGSGSTYNANITNCTFANNQDSTTRNIVKSTVALSQRNGFGIMNTTVANSIFYNNFVIGGTPPSITPLSDNIPSTISIVNSIGADNFSNISATSLTNTSNANPLFTDSVNNDFTLQSGSPAIDSGDNTKVPSGILADLLGNQRIFNTTVDMGVYEFGAPMLGIDDVYAKTKDIKLYPNPVRNTLNILLDDTLEKVEIYTIQGQKVLENNTSNTISVVNLSKGLYILKAQTTSGKLMMKRFIKE